MIYSLVEAQVREAVAKDENRNADGTINWNFVDSDCYMSGVNKFFKDDAAYYEAWDDICFDIDLEEGLKDMSDTAVQLEMDV
jgi:hypothetical protein